MNKLAVWIPASLVAFSLVGCGTSKEDAAVARIMNRPAPGSVRLVNLTGKPASLRIDGKTTSAIAADGTASLFLPNKPASIKVEVLDGDKPVITQTTDLKSGASTTLVAYQGKSGLESMWIEGEGRKLRPGYVTLAGVSVQPGVKISGDGLTDVPIEVGKLTPLSLGAGDHPMTLTDGTSKLPLVASLKDSHTYTLYAYQKAGKLAAVCIQNTPKKPGLSGASGGG